MMSDKLHVVVLKLGIVDRAQAPLAQALLDITRAGDSSSPDGLLHMLNQTCETLHTTKPAWTHGYAQTRPNLSIEDAEAYFRSIQHKERQRFEQETISNQEGQLKETAPLAPVSSEGTGMLVLTILSASRSALPTLEMPPTRSALEHVLKSLQRWKDEDFVAVDVIWTPASPDERVSVAEMEKKHPELTPIHGSA